MPPKPLFSLPRRPKSLVYHAQPLSQPVHHAQGTQTRNISSIQRHLRRPPRNTHPLNRPSVTGLPQLQTGSDGALQRKIAANTLPLRTGAIATKKGMTSIYDPTTGKRIACTVLQLDRVQVVAIKTRQVHGYDAVVLGCGWRRPENVGRAMMGVFAANGLSPKREVREFRVRDQSGLLEPGTVVSASWFLEGQYVDARANARGMGFAGGMKRHGFSGQPASHGNSLTHRAMGSAGPSQGGGSRVHPGKKMAGRMGGHQHTVQNLKVLKVDEEMGLVVVNGCVSGPKGCLVKIQDAIKKPWPEVPAAITPDVGGVAASSAATAA